MNRSTSMNILFFVVFGLILLALSYRFLRPKIASLSQLAVNLRPVINRTSPTPAPNQSSPTPGASTIKIYAAGTPSQNIYPNMDLFINNNKVKSFPQVKGDPARGIFEEYQYTQSGQILSDQVRIRFNNHVYISADEDRNLYVGKINIDGVDLPTDTPTTYTLYTETNPATNKCVSGYDRSRWLRCNGYFNFGTFETMGSTNLLPTPMPSIVTGTIIKIYAAGTPSWGQYPNIQLDIRGMPMAAFNNIQGNPERMQLMEYQYVYPGSVTAHDIRIDYTNDGFNPPTEDRNLLVYKISINGQDYFTNAPTTYATGVWINNSCQAGYFHTNLLSCNGYFQFDTPKVSR